MRRGDRGSEIAEKVVRKIKNMRGLFGGVIMIEVVVVGRYFGMLMPYDFTKEDRQTIAVAEPLNEYCGVIIPTEISRTKVK